MSRIECGGDLCNCRCVRLFIFKTVRKLYVLYLVMMFLLNIAVVWYRFQIMLWNISTVFTRKSLKVHMLIGLGLGWIQGN